MKYIIPAMMLAAMAVHADKTAVIDISGMTCPLCTHAIKHSLKETPGVLRAKVKLNTHQATVTFRDDLNVKHLLKAIEKAGYSGKVLTVESGR